MDYSDLPLVGECRRHPCPSCVAERQRERAEAQEARERPVKALFGMIFGFALLAGCGAAALYLFLAEWRPLYCGFPWLLARYGVGALFAGTGLLAALVGVFEFLDMRQERRARPAA